MLPGRNSVALFKLAHYRNLNSGHDYNNAGLSAADREALVEYMKGV
jgi:hypothetical protein